MDCDGKALDACSWYRRDSHSFAMVSSEMATWASYQIRKLAGCACAGNAGNISQPPQVRDHDMHHGPCVTHVPWCMPGSLTCVFLWSWWRGKRSRHSRCMHNPECYVSGKRSVDNNCVCLTYSILLQARGPFYLQGLTLMLTWISKYIHYYMWEDIVCSFSNFSHAAV